MSGKSRVIAIVIVLLAFLIVIKTSQIEASDDPYFDKQWALSNNDTDIDIDVKSMWKSCINTTSDEQVTVAIIDTGVSFLSDDLRGLQWINDEEIKGNSIDDDKNGYIDDYSGWSFVDNKAFDESQVESYHGTMCAGIIAAKHNGKGIEGVARNVNVKIMPIKVLSAENSIGEGSVKNLIKAINYAEDNGADICNLSLNTTKYSRILYDTIKNSRMLFVSSAGNNNSFLRINIDKRKLYPASFELSNLITVANIDSQGRLDKTSNYGPNSVDLAAPGTNIYCIAGKDNYGYVTGTSFAVPFATGVACQIYATQTDINAKKAKKVICDTVIESKSLKNKCRTEGRLNGAKCLKMILKMKGKGHVQNNK